MAALGGSQTCGSGLKPAPAEPHHGDKDDAERSVRVDQPVDQKRVQQVLSTVRRKQEELVQHQDAWEQLACTPRGARSNMRADHVNSYARCPCACRSQAVRGAVPRRRYLGDHQRSVPACFAA